MTRGKRIYVLDTNVLMHDPTALFRFEEHDVFIPMTVLEELDSAKKGTSETARNARPHEERVPRNLLLDKSPWLPRSPCRLPAKMELTWEYLSPLSQEHRARRLPRVEMAPSVVPRPGQSIQTKSIMIIELSFSSKIGTPANLAIFSVLSL